MLQNHARQCINTKNWLLNRITKKEGKIHINNYVHITAYLQQQKSRVRQCCRNSKGEFYQTLNLLYYYCYNYITIILLFLILSVSSQILIKLDILIVCLFRTNLFRIHHLFLLFIYLFLCACLFKFHCILVIFLKEYMFFHDLLLR